MSKIKPFKAVRPCTNLASEIASLPYDVFNRAEAKQYVEEHPDAFLALDRPETFFPADEDMYADHVYERGAAEYHKAKEAGKFIKENTACYYIYELTMDGRSQTGIVALASVDEYISGSIKKHENTRSEKELDRIHHVDTFDAQTGPIFLAYKANTELSILLHELKKAEPLYDFVKEDGIAHKAWKIDEPETIAKITELFEGIENLYIADGHHRCASAVKVCKMRREAAGEVVEDAEYNGFLSVIFADEELEIFDYNRVVKDLSGRTEGEFMEALYQDFVVSDPSIDPIKPSKKGEVGMYLGNRWYLLTMKPEILSEDPVEGLDVSIMQKYVFDKLLSIMDPKTDERIDFVGGIRGLKELERRCEVDCKAAFAMYPTSMDELFRVADAGLLMPPKSTWFEPKLLSGLFIHELS